ncbi:MAG TPA: aminotransferase class I/II-fold pyridoxal phosphate-dependent enzyme [Trueperaceae bacterium]
MTRTGDDARRTVGSRRIATFGETVFATYSRLARETDAIDLGQGFPDFDPPSLVIEALRDSVDGYQQYPPLPGWPALLEALAADKGGRLGRPLDPTGNLLVTVGATEALFSAMQAFIDPGDEVVLIEPFYDAYPADVIMAGGVPRFVPLEPQQDGRWLLDIDRLRSAFGKRTRMIVVNSPHNPSGKVFSADELDAIIELAEEFDALILADQVYEHISYVPFVDLLSRPGAWERAIAISSFGKTFSVTGWKIGWACGPAPLIATLRTAHQWVPFTVAMPLQEAAARVIRQAAGGSYYRELESAYRRRRDLLLAALAGTPFWALRPEGGYFIVADTEELDYADDVALCLDLPARAGVSAIPPSAFYSPGHRDLARNLVRFAFCKKDEAILEAGERLARLAQ